MYSVQIENGLVSQVIVCESPEWAVKNIGGEWVQADVAPGIGWSYAGGEFIPPLPPPEE